MHALFLSFLRSNMYFYCIRRREKQKKKKTLVNISIYFYIQVPCLEVHLNYGDAVRILKDILQTS